MPLPSRLCSVAPLCLLAGCFGLLADPGGEADGPDSWLGGIPAPAPGPGPDSLSSGADDTADPGGDEDTGASGGPDTGAPDGEAEGPNPLAGLTLWVDPNTNAAADASGASASDADLFDKIAGQPVAKWLGGWNTDVEADVRDAVDVAAADGAVRSFVVYNLPNRDCGGYSSGGASDAAAYRAWIASIAAGLGGRPAIVVLEPDGLSMMDCLSSGEADTRYALIAEATASLRAAGAFVYIDAGHPAWHPSDTMASRLVAAEVASADGFALNTSNFEGTDDILAYGEAISAATGGARFVGDTSRNGLGPTGTHEWCNPAGRALGFPPTVRPDHPLADALLWVKAPGESDGSCNGGPSAGAWWPDYALGLADRAAW